MKNRIRKGDRVKVIEPYIFNRCGYNLTPQIAMDNLIKNNSPEIEEFLKSLGIKVQHKYGSKFTLKSPDQIDMNQAGMRQLMMSLGYLKVASDAFGGSERKIFTKYTEKFKNFEGVVHITKQVMTGEYYPPCFSSYEYDGCEPGGLKNRKSNKILQVSPPDVLIPLEMYDIHNHSIWIEEQYCEKIEEST